MFWLSGSDRIAATDAAGRHPAAGPYVEATYAHELLAAGDGGMGYLLKVAIHVTAVVSRIAIGAATARSVAQSLVKAKLA